MSKSSVLVVDDDNNWLVTVSRLLREQHEVTVTTDPAKALILIGEREFSAVVVDQRLGERAGHELIAELRRLRPNLPAIILTGYPSVEDAFESASAGAVAYLSKASRTLAADLQSRLARAVAPPSRAFLALLRTRVEAHIADAKDLEAATHQVSRTIRVNDSETEYDADALSTLYGWVTEDSCSLVLLRGETGIGKTHLLGELARRLADDENAPVPILIRLWEFDSPPTLDTLLTKRFTELGLDRIDLVAARELVQQGRIVLLFDGLDELADYASEQDFVVVDHVLRRIAVEAKVVAAGRTRYPMLPVPRHVMLSRQDPVPLRLCTLLPFTRGQIHEILQTRIGNAAADAWESLLDTADLEAIVRNPTMLEVVAAIGRDAAFTLPTAASAITPVAEIYRLLLPQWLAADERPIRSDLEGGVVRQARWALLTAVANRIWQTQAPSITVDELHEESWAVVRSMSLPEIDPDALSRSIAASTFLHRDGIGNFQLKHRSILEWLVANSAAEELRQGLAPESLTAAPLTESAYALLVALASAGACVAWAKRVLADEDRFGAHATVLARRLLFSFADDEHAKGWTPAFRWLDWLNGTGDESLVSRMNPASFRSPAVRVRTLRARNIRGFSDSSVINFCDNGGDYRPTTLLLGDNATGKSTLLQCLTIAFLGPTLASHLIPPERLLRHRARSGFIEAEFGLEDPVSDISGSFLVAVELRAGEVSFRAADRSDCTLLQDRNPSVNNAATRIDAIRQLGYGTFGFLCAYGPWRTLNVEPKTTRIQHSNEVLDRVFSLFHSETLLMDPNLLRRVMEGDLSGLEAVIGARSDVLVHAKLVDMIRALLPSSTFDGTGETSFAIHGSPLDLNSLSDGYSSILALVGHVFRHFLQLGEWNGHQPSLNAMILIDEVDLHLHPSWQRRIAADLARVFPEAQLIYSSHSPMVAGSTTPDGIILLKRDGDHIDVHNNVEGVRGWRADQILTSMLFDLDSSRDLETTRMIQRYTDLSVAPSLSLADRLELSDLAAQLRLRLPSMEEKAYARKAFELIETTCQAQLDALEISERERLVTELKAQLIESVTQSHRPS